MNKITTLAAISMFAVIMGMGAFAPAVAVPNQEHSAATSRVCHYDEVIDDPLTLEVDESEESAWIVLYTNSKGQTNGHVNGHGDAVITTDEEAAACVALQTGEVA